jgi:hypothetical protein
MSYDLTALLTEWHNANLQAERWAEIEKDLRRRIFDHAFPKPKVGRNLLKMDHNMVLEGTYRINYKLDANELMRIPNELQQKFVSYTPKVKEKGWLSLTDNERKTCADVVTETPGLPALEIKKQDSIKKW